MNLKEVLLLLLLFNCCCAFKWISSFPRLQSKSVKLFAIQPYQKSEAELDIEKELSESVLLTVAEERAHLRKCRVYFQIETVKEELDSSLDREVSRDELAHYLNLTESQVTNLINLGKESISAVCSANCRLIYQIAIQYRDSGIPIYDLYHTGFQGMNAAIAKFDPERGYRLTTYAVWWVKQSIERLVKQKSYNANSESILITVENISKVRIKFRETFQRQPTISEIAQILGISVTKVENALKQIKKPLRFEEALTARNGKSDNRPMSRGDFIELNPTNVMKGQKATRHEVSLDKMKELENLNMLLHILSPSEANMLSLRYGFIDGRPKTLDEIGKLYGMSKERARQVESRALSKLRSHRELSSSLTKALDVIDNLGHQ